MMARPRKKWATSVAPGHHFKSHESQTAVWRWMRGEAANWLCANPETRHERQLVTVWVDERLGRGWEKFDVVDLETFGAWQ